MKIARQCAVSILRTVFRLASPSTQNWAKAMLAELDSVGNDWPAFFWALGSVRILFVRQTTRLISLSDIPAAAKALSDRMNQRTRLGSVSVSGMALFFGRAFLRVRSHCRCHALHAVAAVRRSPSADSGQCRPECSNRTVQVRVRA